MREPRPCRRTVVQLLVLAAAIASPPARAQLTTLGSQYFDQDSTGIEGEAEADDLFGGALATGDFNCDGFADLAIGVPYEDVTFDCDGDGTADANECGSAGAVNVIYGSAKGLDPSAGHADQILTQATSGVLGSPETFDHFGYAVAAVRTPGRTCDDLAVGVPDEDVTDGPLTHVDAGIVQYFRGTTSGLVPDGQFVQGRDGVPDSSEDDDRFGSSLAMGPDVVGHDFTFDCSDSRGAGTLLIGAPGEDVVLGGNDEGLVIVVVAPCDLAGAGSGDLPSRFNCGPFSPSADCQAISPGHATANNRSGTAVAGGRRPSDPVDGYAAIGVPGDDFGGGDSGSVSLWMSEWPSGSGSFDFERTCAQGYDGAPASAESNDELGHALATGDFDGDGDDDLAAGVIYEDVVSNSVSNGGGVSVFYSPNSSDLDERYPRGVGPPAGQFFDQNDMNGALVAGAGDHFGGALTSGDFDGNGREDLAIGVPDDNISGATDAGAFHVLYGGAGGLSNVGAQTFTLATGALPGDPQPYDHLSYAMAAGDFDGDGRDDLAASTPGERLTTTYGGGVFVLYGGRPSSALCNLVLSVPDTTPAETDGTITVSVERTDNAIVPIDFHYDWSNSLSSATGGADFADFSGTLTWAAGQRGIKTFQVQLLDDTLAENVETLTIDSFETPNVCDGPADLVLNIQSNDVAGSMQFANACASVAEVAASVQINVTRSGGSASGVTVHYATSDGSAVAGSDYTATSGTLTFGVNDTTKSFLVPILADSSDESAMESLELTLSSPGGLGTLGARTTRTLTILDNDGPAIVFADNFECGNPAAWSVVFP